MFSPAGEWLNPDSETERQLRWMTWDGDVATSVAQKKIEEQLDAIAAERTDLDQKKPK